jgi:ubiquitin carboxyl-terminal hydrolase 22/27/51
MHNPLLRNFFLADRHNPAFCLYPEACLACELDRVFGEVRVGEGAGDAC